MNVACIWFDKPVPTQKVAELFLRFSPQICVRGERAIFVEIGKCRKLYSEESFKARAQILVKRQGYKARIGIATDLLQSLALTMFESRDMNDLPLEALMELADPFVRDEVLRKEVLKLVDSFRDLGIKNLGQFKNLPVHELISRFGVVGRHCHSRTVETDKIIWPLWVPEELIQEKKEFPYFEFYGELEPILFELKTQLDSIFARVFSRRKRIMKLQIKIVCEKSSLHPNNIKTLDFNFFTPQSSTKGSLRIVKERLHREFEKAPLKAPVESIQTKVMKMVDGGSSQKNIFNSDEEKFENIYSIHNQLIELIGRENIFQAELTEDRRPERSWRKKFDSPHEKQTDTPNVVMVIPDRTTYLCRHPVKIEVTAGYIHIRKKRYKILHWDNDVEKISGGWFEDPIKEIKDVYDRNYYHVEIEGHQKISVFETPTREFFLHGYYG